MHGLISSHVITGLVADVAPLSNLSAIVVEKSLGCKIGSVPCFLDLIINQRAHIHMQTMSLFLRQHPLKMISPIKIVGETRFVSSNLIGAATMGNHSQQIRRCLQTPQDTSTFRP
jgi:hypothetical protein